MERHVMVLQGGHAAVRQLDPHRLELADTVNGEGSDLNIAMTLVRAFAANDQEAEKYYQWLEARTEGIIGNPIRWFQVRMLAESLLELEQLGARKVREIIREAEKRWCEENQDG
jgi:post-segregation antitoxin (ccd killing protein)